MTHHSRMNGTWPSMLVLSGLFVASVMAPRGWESIAREQGLDDLLAMHRQAPSTVLVARSAPVKVKSAVAVSTPSPTYIKPEPAVANRTVVTALPPVTSLPPVAVLPITTPEPVAAVSVVEVTAVPEQAPTLQAPQVAVAALPTAVESVPESVVPEKVTVVPPLAAPQLAAAQVAPVEPTAPAITETVAPQQPAPVATSASTPPKAEVASLPKREPQVQELTLPGTSPAQPSLPSADVAADMSWCPLPDTLLADLDRLSAKPPVAEWAQHAGRLVRELTAQEAPTSARTAELMKELHTLATELEDRLSKVEDQALVQETKLAGYSLTKRLEIWGHVPSVTTDAKNVAPLTRHDPAKLALCLQAVESQITSQPGGESWGQYMMVDSLKQLASSRNQINPKEQRRLVQRVLDKFRRHSLTQEQQQVLNSGPMADLHDELRQWGAESFNPRSLLVDIERFEKTMLPSDAKKVAQGIRCVSYHPTDEAQELARSLETHYRNSNGRIAISAELLNRLLPEQGPRSSYVDDNMLGYPTKGWSTTNTDLGIRLMPDTNRIRLALVAKGDIYSDTKTYAGPVTLRTLSDSEFLAAQEIEVGLDGIQLHAVEVDADTDPHLKGIRTDYDRVPGLGAFVRKVAQKKNDETMPQARMLAIMKIKREFKSQMKKELHPKIAKTNEKMQKNFLQPLQAMDIQPEVIEASTTPERFTLRVRMAGEEQLAGHSPRPRAPEGSLASFQVHQSLLNNVCEALDLDGKTRSLPELQKELAERLNWDGELKHDPKTEDLFITFAKQDPIHVHCDDGRVEITLAIEQLRKGYDKWEDFVIRVAYRPDMTNSNCVLVRDGTVRLSGNKLNSRAQLALRGIFSKAFPKDRGIQILPQKMADNPNFADIGVTQFDIRDGWIGVSLGTKDTIPHHSQAMR